MAGKLTYSVYTENLIEIAFAYAELASRYPDLTETDSITWKQQFVKMANEFEDNYPEPGHWGDSDYLDFIDGFAREKIFEFAGMEQKMLSDMPSEGSKDKLISILLDMCLHFAGSQYTESVLRTKGFGDSELATIGFEVDGEWSEMDPSIEI